MSMPSATEATAPTMAEAVQSTSAASESSETSTLQAVRRRGTRFVQRGQELYHTEEFLKNVSNFEELPNRAGCMHEILDRAGTNQHKRRYKCPTCAAMWSGR